MKELPATLTVNRMKSQTMYDSGCRSTAVLIVQFDNYLLVACRGELKCEITETLNL